MYSYNGRRYDKIETNTFWQRLKSNIVKRWRVIIVPFKRFFIPGGVQDETPEPEPVAEPEPVIEEPVVEEVFEEPRPAAEPEPEIDTSGMSQSDLDLANEIFARLQAEAAADEAAKVAEIEEAKMMAEGGGAKAEPQSGENHNISSYNATTKSFSGDYGTGPVDDETADLVAELLKQNNRSGVDF
ncbi:MAG: hypothetical protein K6G40_07740 [Eubacterium sp.]|nr:hypothetical protein [Eubacterium sp.]